MTKAHGQREFRTGGDTECRGSIGRQLGAQAGRRPSADVVDEELLVCREPLRVEGEGVRAAAR
jgi:hypothetical protein